MFSQPTMHNSVTVAATTMAAAPRPEFSARAQAFPSSSNTWQAGLGPEFSVRTQAFPSPSNSWQAGLNDNGGGVSGGDWTFEENKYFENAIADASCGISYTALSALIPWKSTDQIVRHYQALVHDVNSIESGFYDGVMESWTTRRADETSKFVDPSSSSWTTRRADETSKFIDPSSSSWTTSRADETSKFVDPSSSSWTRRRADETGEVADPSQTPPCEKAKVKRRRGIPWTEDEHQRFLKGIKKFGRGDWKSISRYFVETKTPMQVASHAQKYFNRRQRADNEKRRRSINDIQTIVSTSPSPTPPSSPSQHPEGNPHSFSSFSAQPFSSILPRLQDENPHPSSSLPQHQDGNPHPFSSISPQHRGGNPHPFSSISGLQSKHAQFH